MQEQLLQLQEITNPFASGSAHVQGPGGNTSVKSFDQLLIKASGFTFKDIAKNNGVVLLDNTSVVKNLKALIENSSDGLQSKPPLVLYSIPPLAKPSMEYEFHSILDNYVLHTHSVYANIVNCCLECPEILSSLFNENEYILIPYLTPGFPIAAYLLKLNLKKIPPIIFLKNHGIIVHGQTSKEVLSSYNYVQEKITEHFNLLRMPELDTYYASQNERSEKPEKIFLKVDVTNANEEFYDQILIPDQSIFFKNKVSSSPESDIFLDYDKNEIVIKGTAKFVEAAKSMVEALYFIRKSILSLGLTLDFIAARDIDILHGLDSEKYRTSLLNK